MNTKRTPSGRQDISVFFGAFVIGVSIIMLMKVLGAPALVSTILVASVVVVYGVVVTQVPRLRFRLDQAGDNAYYLGLLFTLISMALALYGVSRGVNAESAGSESFSMAERIIGDFGIALASTIAGILVRIVLHQMRVDPADIEHASRLELAMAAERLGEKLKDITVRMSEFYEETRQRSEDSTKALLEDYRVMSGQICTQLMTLSVGFAESLSILQQGMTASIGGAASQIDSVTASFEGAVERLRAVEPPPTLLNERLKKIVASLEGTGALLGQATGHLSTVSDQLLVTGANIADANSRSSAKREDQLEQDVEMANRTAVAVRGLEERLVSLNELGLRHATVVHELETSSLASADAVKQAQLASTEVLTALTGVTDRLQEAISEARQVENER